MPAKVLLQVISGPIQGKVFEFEKHDTFIFGRGTECHAKLPKDGYVSRHHFLLEVNPPEATIRDLRSLNGTHVNGVRYGGRKARAASADGNSHPGPQAVLKDRDLIVVGKTKIRVRIGTPRAKPSCTPDALRPLPARQERHPGSGCMCRRKPSRRARSGISRGRRRNKDRCLQKSIPQQHLPPRKSPPMRRRSLRRMRWAACVP